MSGEKPKYRVMRLSHIHNNLWPEGSEIEYDGEPGSALEPINDAAKAAKAKVTGKAAEVVTSAKPINDADEDGDLDKIREEYEMLFNEKPHHNAKAETLREKIADKRKELGV
ncbi:hypothetical protein QOQ01_001819 [Salmonella enterica]|uniref:Phage protein n=2 Tax=Salmonella enterica TaxID=28901 RepID=A0A622QJZ5_SALDZ|nr:hypothetical protein [Salmonella enterica]EAA2773553.1 hypothetical protein [Salmonella enterica subsp. diarizonae]EAO4364777.1 hypothetical protein [Salmonella enterica subsp. enterica serovar Bere]EAW2473187.1 hypothetical protein [Salmonella enterica subsp. enterica]EBF8309614.1 hypothetical protein [Salmonella enterica subsp. enterica serovar Tamberma]ECS6773224.1 hypothetical protein [Salmonella enterica subsp. diarizonae serovar 65:z10:e,n,x,z15]EDN4535954.1 hypothetical protein [Sal